MKIIKAVLEDVALFCLGPILRAPVFEGGIFKLTMHRLVTTKLLNI
jgi:hypothetical protein